MTDILTRLSEWLASAKKKYGDYSDSSTQPSDGQRCTQATLTNEKREAIAHAADLLVGSRPGATLRALLERLA